MSEIENSNPINFDLSADTNEGVTAVESLCVQCGENGETKFLFVKIPFYREVIISSFYCPYCNWSNNEISSAAAVMDMGAEITLKVTKIEDLNRQIVKSDSATFKIEELEFEIPAFTQKGTLSTLEGIITRAIEGLMQDQPVRLALHPEDGEKVGQYVEKMKRLLKVENPFTIVVDDPSGNSFVENPYAPSDDKLLKTRFYKRTEEQQNALKLELEDKQPEEKPEISLPSSSIGEISGQGLNITNEVLTFKNPCSRCYAMCDTNMKMVKMPYFKEIIVMATTCDLCGHRTNEVKSGSGFEPTGKKITLNFMSEEDLKRDVLKSETCKVLIPQIELETGAMALSGKFTTIEGLLVDLKKMLVEKNPFVNGDSAQSTKLKEVGSKIDSFISGREAFTLILDDPNSNSYIQSYNAPDPDPSLVEEVYERSWEQNEELGLNDMKTENYMQNE